MKINPSVTISMLFYGLIFVKNNEQWTSTTVNVVKMAQKSCLRHLVSIHEKAQC
jgi:hypothetical protein